MPPKKQLPAYLQQFCEDNPNNNQDIGDDAFVEINEPTALKGVDPAQIEEIESYINRKEEQITRLETSIDSMCQEVQKIKPQESTFLLEALIISPLFLFMVYILLGN